MNKPGNPDSLEPTPSWSTVKAAPKSGDLAREVLDTLGIASTTPPAKAIVAPREAILVPAPGPDHTVTPELAGVHVAENGLDVGDLAKQVELLLNGGYHDTDKDGIPPVVEDGHSPNLSADSIVPVSKAGEVIIVQRDDGRLAESTVGREEGLTVPAGLRPQGKGPNDDDLRILPPVK